MDQGQGTETAGQVSGGGHGHMLHSVDTGICAASLRVELEDVAHLKREEMDKKDAL